MRYLFNPVSSSSSTSSEVSSTVGISSELNPGSGVGSVNLIGTSADSSSIEPIEAVKTCVGLPGVTPENYKANWDRWHEVDELDWLQITPDYAQGNGELRSRADIKLISVKDGNYVDTFPTMVSQSSGNPVAWVDLLSYGNQAWYSNGTNAAHHPSNTNFESLHSSFIHAYQTDYVTGPSEKILFNIKRLRVLGFSKVQLRFGGFYIITNDIGNIPVKVKLVSGGYPTVVDIGPSPKQPSYQYRNWSFPGGKTLNELETIVNATVTSGDSNSPNYWLTIDVDLEKRTLHYIY